MPKTEISHVNIICFQFIFVSLSLALHLHQMQSYKWEKMPRCKKTIYKVVNNSKNQEEKSRETGKSTFNVVYIFFVFYCENMDFFGVCRGPCNLEANVQFLCSFRVSTLGNK